MPIVSEEAFKKTESIVKEFSKPGGIGMKLQEILLEYAEEKDNWAYDWWLDDMYMQNKLPLPINSNPGMIFPRENFINEDSYLKFVARLISGIMDYKLIIDA
jgi:choline O-acetyltransferase